MHGKCMKLANGILCNMTDFLGGDYNNYCRFLIQALAHTTDAISMTILSLFVMSCM